MFGKHVQQRALKKQYGLSFDDETISQSQSENGVPEYQPKPRKDITPQQETIEQTNEEAKSESDHLRDEINAKFKQLGINSNKDAAEWLKVNAPDVNPKTATESEMVGLIELLNMNIEIKEVQEAQEDDEML